VANEISKTQIDRLGDRLREGNITESDLRLLDEYRRSFGAAYEFVVGAIRNRLGFEPTGRPAKSTTSIIEKLLRESIRLTQIQDIAGCRLIVPTIMDQEVSVQSLSQLLKHVTIVDRRKQPSHGYRAIHVITTYESRVVEIQIRTSLQHIWAELSEKLSDIIDPGIKYGGGSEGIQDFLARSSSLIDAEESNERDLANKRARLSLQDSPKYRDELQKIADLQKEFTTIRKEIFSILQDAIDDVPKLVKEVR